jgi:5-methyltetrahydropteroyltriglutamate--homocysteine methyltransferase
MEADPRSGLSADPEVADLLRSSIIDVVCRQRDVGVDIPNDGEFSHVSWGAYLRSRLSGYEVRPAPAGRRGPQQHSTDRATFPEFYREMDESGTTYYRNPGQIGRRGTEWVCTGPVAYAGQAALQQDIANLKAALAGAGVEEGFMTSTAPSGIGEQNLYYESDEAYLFALADAMRVEFQAIVAAGFVLHIDHPWFVCIWDHPSCEMDLVRYEKKVSLLVDALNHALVGIPEDRVRLHICYGSWHGPHSTDIPLEYVAPFLVKVKAGAYAIEAANARHEHEWEVWKDLKLPDGRILIPGVISHMTNVIEHPELISTRLKRYASVVGKENVMAGTDCGLGYRVHPEIAWAKLKALADGARRASQFLW